MTEKMLEFMKAYGIELPTEIEGNPYEGLTSDEIAKVNQILIQDHIIV